jgi:hypothetical protein
VVLLGWSDWTQGAEPWQREDPRACAFWVLRERDLHENSEYGMVMFCPSHAYGTLADGVAMLRRRLATQPPGALSTVWVCRADQDNGLKAVAPLVDQVAVNPFAHTGCGAVLADSTSGWAGSSHPILVRVRECRAFVPDRRLLACVDLTGEGLVFGDRQPAFEEVEWMALAAVGGGFQGIVWRGDAQAAWAARLGTFAHNLRRFAVPLGSARLGGASAIVEPVAPVAVTCSGQDLFVVVLNPAYMHQERGRPVAFPLRPEPFACRVILAAPGLRAGTAIDLDGFPVVPLTPAANGLSFDLVVPGGGTLVALTLERPGASPRSDTPTTEE